MLVFLASITCVSASALDNGIYVAKSSPHYKHPVTGVIEDSGGENSQVLGQSMTESALYPEALIEVDPNGKMFATIRLKLMDNIENPTFKVQSRGDSGFKDVSYDIMKEDFSKNQSDFRFEIPNENCIIRATFYVVPMGRDVIFYIDFSDIHEGSSDFVTSVEVKKPETTTTTTVTTTKPAETTSSEQTTSPETTSPTTASTEETTEATEQETTTTTTTTTTSTTTTTTTTTKAIETTTEDYTIPETVENNAKGAAFFDAKGQQIYPLADKKSSSAEEKKEERSIALPIAIACGVCVIACVGGIVFYRKRRA